MDKALPQKIRQGLKDTETADLLRRWEENDREQYTDAFFEAVELELKARGAHLPSQRQPLPPPKAIQFTTAEPIRKKPSRGMIWLGVVLMAMSLYPLFAEPLSPGPGIRAGELSFGRMAATSSPLMQAILVTGGVVIFGLCLLWYRLGQTYPLRKRFPRVLGTVVFVVGLPFLMVGGFGQFGQREVWLHRLSRHTDPTGAALSEPGTYVGLVLMAMVLAVGFLLHFRFGTKRTPGA